LSRRGTFNTEDGIAVRPMPDADPTAGVRVRVTSVGICSTDFWVLAQGPSPFVIGHEFGGYLDDGTLAAVYPLARCGECDQCSAGAYNRCRRVFELSMGLGTDGGMCDELFVPEDAITRLPDGVAPRDALLVEPFAVAVHALERVDLQPGQRVAVIGAGSLGLIVAAATKAAGCDTSISARHLHQVTAAEKLELGLGELSGEYDVVVDAAGSEAALTQAVELLAPGGTLLILGMYPPAGINFPALPLLMKEANVVTSTAYCCNNRKDDFAASAEFLASTPALAEALISHRFPLEEAPAAFDAARDRASGAIKVVVHPQSGGV
jgi:2-desacetyl-2-hydroxyethyl bacteriochlorophyllide A dehydrogenase